MNVARWLRILTALVVCLLVGAAGVASLALGTVDEGLGQYDDRVRAARGAELYRTMNTMSAAAQDLLLVGNGKGLGDADSLKDVRVGARESYLDARRDFHRQALDLSADQVAFPRHVLEGLVKGVGAYDRRISGLLGPDLTRAVKAPGPLAGADLREFRSTQGAFDRVRAEAREAGDNGDLRAEDVAAGGVFQLSARAQAATLLGASGIAFLVILQIYLARRFRRVLNPALIVAALGVVVAGTLAFTQIGTVRDRLAVADEEEAGRLSSAYQARADSHALPSEEAEFLLDPGTPEWTYLEVSTDVFSIAADRLDSYQASLPTASRPKAAESPLSQAQVYRSYVDYQAADQLVRRAVAERAPMKALDDHLREAGPQFRAYDEHLELVIDRQREKIAIRTALARGELTAWKWIIPGAAAGAIGLILIGVRPRLKEYT